MVIPVATLGANTNGPATATVNSVLRTREPKPRRICPPPVYQSTLASGERCRTRGRGGAHLSLIHISEPTRLRRISYAVFCLKKKKTNQQKQNPNMSNTNEKQQNQPQSNPQ